MITKQLFGKTAAGEEVYVYTMTNANGLSVQVINFGARLLTVNIPDRDGNFANVNFAPDTLAGFEERNNFFGATIGRFCNRIAGASFELDGETYSLTVNEHGIQTLHGGNGVHNLVWDSAEDGKQVVMTRLLEDGQDGFPGNCTIVARFELTEENTLILGLQATTDKATVINLTNHAYWNLGGPVSEQILMISADEYLDVERKTRIPLAVAKTEGTMFDFRQGKEIGHEFLDHHFIFNADHPRTKLHDPVSGRTMTMECDMPGVMLYTHPKFRTMPLEFSAVCLEPQYNPDSPHHPEWPTTVLRPGEVWDHNVYLTFSVE